MHSITRRRLLGGAAATAGLGLAIPAATFAQDRVNLASARVTVGFPAGDMADSIARLVSESIRGRFAETVLVDNKPGAAARLAISQYVRYKNDGSEVLFTPGAMVVLFPHVFEKLAYDPLKELTPVTNVASSSFVLAVGPGVPAEVRTLQQYLAWTKRDSRNLSYATSGAGSGIHLSAEYLGKLSNTPLQMVAYKGASLAANDLVAGQVPAQMASLPSLIEFARAGKVRILAVTSAERLQLLPDVPTFNELGYPQLVTDDFFGFFLPAGAPAAAVRSLDASIQRALKDEKVAATLEKMGLALTPSSDPAAFGAFVQNEHRKWGTIAKTVGFKPLA
jgi:tripartite-type tricarboxylate transporter receptor subunit TctC